MRFHGHAVGQAGYDFEFGEEGARVGIRDILRSQEA